MSSSNHDESKIAPTTARQWSLWRRVKGNEAFTFDQDYRRGLKPQSGQARGVRFAVILPAWCSSVTVHFVRLCTATNKKIPATIIAGKWIEEKSVVFTADGLDFMILDGDYIGLFADTIGGTINPALPIEILYKAVSETGASR